MDERVFTYLREQMKPDDRAAFERELTESEALRDELVSGRAVLETILASGDGSVRETVNRHIRTALENGASDIHLSPRRDGIEVRMRVDGVLVPLETLPAAQRQLIVDRWKIMADMSLTERRLPQTGRISVRWETGQRDLELRTMTLPTLHGEKVVARILDRTGDFRKTLAELELSDEQRAQLIAMLERPHGLLLVCGPAGSGRTTLGYALLRHLVARHDGATSLISVEDPIELELPGVDQTQVNRSSGLDLATLVRAGVFRADPDIVYLSGLPDKGAIQAAMELARTGHLVIAVTAGESWRDALAHVTDAGIDPAHLIGLVETRLARRISPENRTEYMPDASALTTLSLAESDGPFVHGAGHPTDRQTGFRGRVGLYAIRAANELSADATPISGTLKDAARALVRSQITTAEEALRVLWPTAE